MWAIIATSFRREHPDKSAIQSPKVVLLAVVGAAVEHCLQVYRTEEEEVQTAEVVEVLDRLCLWVCQAAAAAAGAHLWVVQVEEEVEVLAVHLCHY